MAKKITGVQLKYKFIGTPEDLEEFLDELNNVYSAESDIDSKTVEIETVVTVTLTRKELVELVNEVIDDEVGLAGIEPADDIEFLTE